MQFWDKIKQLSIKDMVSYSEREMVLYLCAHATDHNFIQMDQLTQQSEPFDKFCLPF